MLAPPRHDSVSLLEPRPTPISLAGYLGGRLRGWGEAWYRFAAPPLPSEMWRSLVEERDRYRRGRLVAVAVGLTTIFAFTGLASNLPGLVAVLQNGQLATFPLANTGGAALFLLTCLVLARVNHRGHMEAAGMLCGLLLMVAIAGVLVIGDIAAQGFGWIDSAGWDLMAVGVLAAAATTRARLAFLVWLGYLGLIGALITFIPQQPEVLAAEFRDGFLSATMAASTQNLVLHFDLLFRPVILSLFCLLLGVATNRGVLRALRDLGAQEHLADQRQRIIGEREHLLEQQLIQEHWITHVIASLNMALTQGARFVPPDLPASWRDNQNLVALHGLLAGAGRRLEQGQRAEQAIALLQTHMQQLPAQLQQRRASGERTGKSGALQDLDLDYLAVAEIQTQFAPMDTVLAHLRAYLGQLEREKLAASQEILKAIGDFANANNLNRRVSDRYLRTQFGEIVFAVNWLFGQTQARLTSRSSAEQRPFS